MKDNKPEKEKIAVALKYQVGKEAPEVIAGGRGIIAERIIREAEKSDVPTYEDKGLAETLSKLDVGDMIPPELYGAVAEILVFVDKMDKLREKVL